MYLLLVVVLFTSSCYSVSSHQYYVSDNCSSVTHTPCGPLSNYARNISQYNNTIFYIIGAIQLDYSIQLERLQNITIQGIDRSPAITCARYYYNKVHVILKYSSHVNIVNMTFNNCYMSILHSNNITINNSIILSKRLVTENVYDMKIISTVINSSTEIIYNLHKEFIPRGMKHYSLTLMNVSVQQELRIRNLDYSNYLLMKIDQVKAKGGIYIGTDINSFYSLHITNTSSYKSMDLN